MTPRRELSSVFMWPLSWSFHSLINLLHLWLRLEPYCVDYGIGIGHLPLFSVDSDSLYLLRSDHNNYFIYHVLTEKQSIKRKICYQYSTVM